MKNWANRKKYIIILICDNIPRKIRDSYFHIFKVPHTVLETGLRGQALQIPPAEEGRYWGQTPDPGFLATGISESWAIRPISVVVQTRQRFLSCSGSCLLTTPPPDHPISDAVARNFPLPCNASVKGASRGEQKRNFARRHLLDILYFFNLGAIMLRNCSIFDRDSTYQLRNFWGQSTTQPPIIHGRNHFWRSTAAPSSQQGQLTHTFRLLQTFK